MVVSSPERGEHTAFYPGFPLKESTAKAFGWLFLWNFKEKASTVFYGTAFQKSAPPLRIMSMFPHPLKAFLKRRADEHAGGGGGEGAGAGQEMQ